MTLYHLQASLQDRSLLPRDEYVNTISINLDPAVDPAIVGVQLCQDFAAFYGTLAGYYSDQVKTGVGSLVSTVKLYKHEGLPPHPPLAVHYFSMGSPAAVSPLPSEVAVCLSFRSSLAPAGTKPASARGRIYLGPFNAGVMNAPATGSPSRPSQAFRDAVLDAAVTLGDTLGNAGHGAAWVVASPTLHRWYQVTEARCDDAFDTQRSRGCRPTTVSTRVVVAENGGPAQGTWVPTR